MDFEEGIRKLLQPAAAHRPRLLGAKHNDCELDVRKPLSSLDAGDHAEGAVELAAVRHRIEVRAGPYSRSAAAADQIAGLVGGRFEPRFAHPVRGELVGCVLLRRVAGSGGTDGIDLVEALKHPHGGMIPHGAERIVGLASTTAAAASSAGAAPKARTG